MSAAPVALPALGAVRRRRGPRLPLLLLAGGLAVALIGSYVATNVYASLGQRHLRDRYETTSASWSSLDPLQRSSLTFAPGAPVARMRIPAVGIDVVVAEGATPSIMRTAPGHLPASAIPGAEGVAIITANRFGFGSFFLRLGGLTEGDQIVTESALGRTTYTVAEVRTVPAPQLDLATESTGRVLLLFGSGRLWGGPDRLMIRAIAEGPPA